MNKDTDFYLYAKDWYERSGDLYYDLRVIAANNSDFKHIEINRETIMHKLLSLTWFEMEGNRFPNYLFITFCNYLDWGSVASACLNILAGAGTGMQGRERLGKPSSNVLPLSATAKHNVDDPVYEWAERNSNE